MTLALISNSRSELGPLAAVARALPEAAVMTFDASGMHPALAMSQALTYFTAMFRNAKTTRVVLLGDRYETLAAALAAVFSGISVAHIHGGETTTGAFDDPIRHALTHIADTHFVAHEMFAERVAQMKGLASLGGHDARTYAALGIHVVGAPGIDGVEANSATRSERIILASFHPETRAADGGMDALSFMLGELMALKDYKVFFTAPNCDPGNEDIHKLIDDVMHTQPDWHWLELPHSAYVTLMQGAALCIGNSSAFVIDAPWVGLPSVLIGNRQNGRPLAPSVFQWSVGDKKPLADVITSAMMFSGYGNCYYTGGPVGHRIATILRQGEKV